MKYPYPWVALGLGILLGMTVIGAGALDPAAEHKLPLLMLLLMCEFGAIATAIGAALGLRDMAREGVQTTAVLVLAGNLAIAGGLLWTGLRLWPGTAGGAGG